METQKPVQNRKLGQIELQSGDFPLLNNTSCRTSQYNLPSKWMQPAMRKISGGEFIFYSHLTPALLEK